MTVLLVTDHLVEELHEGRSDKVANYLQPLDRDLAKANSLAGLGRRLPWAACFNIQQSWNEADMMPDSSS